MLTNRRPTLVNIISAVPICLALLLIVGAINHQLKSASLSTVSVTSSNPRPSFRGALAAGNTVGSTLVTINTTANAYPSTSSAQLVEGDVMRIGEGGSLGSYTVASTSSLSTFSITTALASGDTELNDDVISTSSANLTTRLTTVNAIANGRFRILVPALTSASAASDGIPDGGFFDFGNGPAATVTCPSNATATYDFVNGAATASAQTINGVAYHVFECAYSGTGAAGTAFNGSGNDPFTINSIINPAPKTSHTTGLADTYPVIIQQLDSAFNLVDTTTVNIAVIEAVRVTAYVPPQITFQIIGMPAGTTRCGIAADVSTTAASVPFGPVSISAFTNATQALTVSTNASGGYVVTAIENDQLGLNGAACPSPSANCIPDSPGDDAAMTSTNSDEWNLTTTKGFAYSLDNFNSTGLTPAFEYDVASGSCAGTYCARQFADAAAAAPAVTIFSNASVADNQNLFVCYKIVVAATQSAGNYENYVTYNATATF